MPPSLSPPPSPPALPRSLPGQQLPTAAGPAAPGRGDDPTAPQRRNLRSPQQGGEWYPACSFGIPAPQKERREGPLSSGAPSSGLALLFAVLAAIFPNPAWQPGAVSVPFPPRPNLKDGFNIYLLALRLRRGSGRARREPSAGPEEARPPPRHRAVLLNE